MLHPIEKSSHSRTAFSLLNILSFVRLSVLIDGNTVEIDAIKLTHNSAAPYPRHENLPPIIPVPMHEVVLHIQGPVVLSINSGIDQ